MIIAWTNTLAVPYVLFSLYYQWRVARQWCVLCLTVQALLVMQLMVSLTGGWHYLLPLNAVATGAVILPLVTACLLPFVTVSLLLPAYRAAKENRQSRTELQRLKHNPQIFEALLARQKVITEDTKGLGIELGDPGAKYTIVKVCNPYCGPCAQAHVPMEEILHSNPDVRVQIIFTATTHEGDMKAPPVKHLLAIDQHKGKDMVTKALDDWYLAEQKDYDVFATKYPMNGELKKLDHKINAMDEWCRKMDIRFTPTFFINGSQLPDIYSVNDLKYFLAV